MLLLAFRARFLGIVKAEAHSSVLFLCVGGEARVARGRSKWIDGGRRDERASVGLAEVDVADI